MVHVFRVAEAAAEREVAGNDLFANPIDQVAEQDGVTLNRFARGFALIPLLEPPELQRIVLAAGAEVAGDEVVVRDLVTLLRMIPEPTDILDELADVVDEQVVDGDHP